VAVEATTDLYALRYTYVHMYKESTLYVRRSKKKLLFGAKVVSEGS